MTLFIKYMVSIRCKMLVKEELKKLGLHFIFVDLGVVEIMETITPDLREEIRLTLLRSGLELMDDKKAVLIEKIKNAIIEVIYYTDEMPKINFPDYISGKLGQDYIYLSKLFSEVQGTTIENFIISHKIERVKELLIYKEFNLTEIAFRLHYSSVAHLSNQFKKLTGLTPSNFKNLKYKGTTTVEEPVS